MQHGCPNSHCIYYQKKNRVVRDGRYYRKDDSRWIKRFRCMACGRRFSNATGTHAFGQKKRRKNSMVRHLLCSNVSMRRVAKILNIHRVTVARKLVYLAQIAEISQCDFLLAKTSSPARHVQFDDLITHEHTKLKPLTVTLAVDADTRQILGAKVNTIGAFGKIATKSREKYGARKNTHSKGIMELFEDIQRVISPTAEIRSDEHKKYKPQVDRYFPSAKFRQFTSARARDDGQGEMKNKKYDPLFYINHTLAMLRSNICRLIRRTWSTTKLAERLAMHIAIYIDYHNNELI